MPTSTRWPKTKREERLVRRSATVTGGRSPQTSEPEESWPTGQPRFMTARPRPRSLATAHTSRGKRFEWLRRAPAAGPSAHRRRSARPSAGKHGFVLSSADGPIGTLSIGSPWHEVCSELGATAPTPRRHGRRRLVGGRRLGGARSSQARTGDHRQGGRVRRALRGGRPRRPTRCRGSGQQ